MGELARALLIAVAPTLVHQTGEGVRDWPCARREADGEAVYFQIDRASQTLREVEAPTEAKGEDDTEAREAARDAKAEAMAERLLAALVKANAKGVRITSREDLRGLVKGGNDLKARAVSLLITGGRIEGGNKKPFTPCYQTGEGEE